MNKKLNSIYQKCYENLSKELADYILSRWDYEKNVDKNGNAISPKDVSYGSKGINKKGYWFKCLNHPNHKSEQKNIYNFLKIRKSSLDCIQCNSISITHPEIVRFLVNPEDALRYSYGSKRKKFLVKCPDCGLEKDISIVNLIKVGFGCSRCSDGRPYTEKLFFSVLEQLNAKFKPQLTKKTLKWCGDYKYDFYIDEINGIVETHGLQHYEQTSGVWGSLAEIQENDRQKELLAKSNEIKEDSYIIIDCRKSELEWIKNSIMESKLPKLLNLKNLTYK